MLIFEIKLLFGFLLDFAFGDPHGLPHPVVKIAKLSLFLEKFFYNFKNKKRAGLIFLLSVLIIVYFVSYILISISQVIEVYLIYTVLAARSLADESYAVYCLLKEKRIRGARRKLGFLVSRDVESLPVEKIVSSLVETISENFVDGVLSPLIYLVIGGVPMAMTFKAVSTLDSMVGYKNKVYSDFGWASARLDDILNYVPARLCGFVFMPVISFFTGNGFINTIKMVYRDRKKLDSPNSAYSESAFAAILGIRIGGPYSYDGKVKQKPYIGDGTVKIHVRHAMDAICLLYISTLFSYLLILILSIILKYSLNIYGT